MFITTIRDKNRSYRLLVKGISAHTGRIHYVDRLRFYLVFQDFQFPIKFLRLHLSSSIEYAYCFACKLKTAFPFLSIHFVLTLECNYKKRVKLWGASNYMLKKSKITRCRIKGGRGEF